MTEISTQSNKRGSGKIIWEYKYYFLIVFIIVLLLALWSAADEAKKRYQTLLSNTIFDRSGIAISIKENSKGHYVNTLEILPEDFRRLLILKEDKYFYYHPGINPLSNIKAIYQYIIGGQTSGASTITQQLTKNLLGNELERNLTNKLQEAFYAFGIELFYTKDEILIMYANTVYLGNQVQGFETGSHAYFNKPLKETSHSEQLSLLTTLSYPNARNPWAEVNTDFALALNDRIAPGQDFAEPKKTTGYSFQKDSWFELRTAGVTCAETCYTTIDNALTEKIRGILNRHITTEWDRGARNGAIVVIDPKTSEIIALVGTKNPNNVQDGDQINMALEPRPIGSTIKPILYLKGFMEGLRPYSLVVDREYKYPIATGFPLYPKNYDGKYRGEVTLHEALSNSLNVPTVKVLEYIGLNNFYEFLSGKLRFEPIQDYDSYQYGIALGGLEMDLLTLTHYFTIFPKLGTIEPIHILKNKTENFSLPPQSNIETKQIVADEKFTQLIHAIISDRLSGVDQFGLKSNLNLTALNYGVKTGTSRDFHDSWVVGYTGDFVVGVWLGNTENKPLEQVTGQSGAGAIWHDTMSLLLESSYNKNTEIANKQIAMFPIKNSNEWGLPEDIVGEHQKLLLEDTLILSPYQKDAFEFFPGITIPLKGNKELVWSVNGKTLGTDKDIEFKPEYAGKFEIMATDRNSGKREIILISVLNPQ